MAVIFLVAVSMLCVFAKVEGFDPLLTRFSFQKSRMINVSADPPANKRQIELNIDGVSLKTANFGSDLRENSSMKFSSPSPLEISERIISTTPREGVEPSRKSKKKLRRVLKKVVNASMEDMVEKLTVSLQDFLNSPSRVRRIKTLLKQSNNQPDVGYMPVRIRGSQPLVEFATYQQETRSPSTPTGPFEASPSVVSHRVLEGHEAEKEDFSQSGVWDIIFNNILTEKEPFSPEQEKADKSERVSELRIPNSSTESSGFVKETVTESPFVPDVTASSTSDSNLHSVSTKLDKITSIPRTESEHDVTDRNSAYETTPATNYDIHSTEAPNMPENSRVRISLNQTDTTNSTATNFENSENRREPILSESQAISVEANYSEAGNHSDIAEVENIAVKDIFDLETLITQDGNSNSTVELIDSSEIEATDYSTVFTNESDDPSEKTFGFSDGNETLGVGWENEYDPLKPNTKENSSPFGEELHEEDFKNVTEHSWPSNNSHASEETKKTSDLIGGSAVIENSSSSSNTPGRNTSETLNSLSDHTAGHHNSKPALSKKANGSEPTEASLQERTTSAAEISDRQKIVTALPSNGSTKTVRRPFTSFGGVQYIVTAPPPFDPADTNATELLTLEGSTDSRHPRWTPLFLQTILIGGAAGFSILLFTIFGITLACHRSRKDKLHHDKFGHPKNFIVEIPHPKGLPRICEPPMISLSSEVSASRRPFYYDTGASQRSLVADRTVETFFASASTLQTESQDSQSPHLNERTAVLY